MTRDLDAHRLIDAGDQQLGIERVAQAVETFGGPRPPPPFAIRLVNVELHPCRDHQSRELLAQAAPPRRFAFGESGPVLVLIGRVVPPALLL